MNQNILIGTYTKKTSKGIYQIELDTTDKKLKHPKLVLNIQNPTYLSHYDKKIYSIDKKNDTGGIAIINDSNYSIEQELLADGAPPAYISWNPINKIIMDANYHKGTITAYQKDNNSNQFNVVDVFQNHIENKESHLHYVDLAPDKKLIACDLGTDQVLTLEFENNKFNLLDSYNTNSGFGPRHITFNKSGSYAYLVGELSSEVEVLSYQNGIFKHLQTVSTVPKNFSSNNGAAAIRLDKNDKYLYVSNRGHDSISVFEIQNDGTLKSIQNITVSGSFPRDFNLDSTDQFLVCANQESDNITLFERNTIDGKLTTLQTDVKIPEGVCVLFL